MATVEFLRKRVEGKEKELDGPPKMVYCSTQGLSSPRKGYKRYN